jgi:fermentation-respiration switch protein FrsA (DUF1100 family)
MKRKMLCIGSVVVMVLAGAMFSGCVQEQKPAGKTSDELAVDIVSLLKDKNYTGVYSFFNSSITTQITVEQFQNIWEQQIIIPNGNLTKIVKTSLTIESGYSIVYVTCNFTKQNVLDVKIIFNAQNKVISLTVNPPQTGYQYAPPSYVNLSAFTEMNISVGSGQWKLPGTLSIPKGAGPFPAVVLVHGSGPNDRDESVGSNKPFKDIAGGLASKGIVVLRYEKRTRQYPQESVAIQNFTVQDETIADALVAVNVLDASSAVNHSRIFVLGHSLGGMLAPRIGVQDHRIAGIIILAGPTRHLEDLILEQSRYLANISGINQSEQIASLEKLVMKVKMLNISLGEDVLGAPKAYWADLATYDPIVTAQSLHIPLLILQGRRDYQVTMTDFARWNETFFGNASVTLKTYTTLNHLFITGTGVPSYNEYLVEGHVAEEIVADIAAWIKNR